MAFFPRNFYNTTASDTSFTPLFRLLDDFDTYSRQAGGNIGNGNGRRQQATPSWQPKFDIRETGEAYELHGELPGLSKEHVSIEFTEPQTMLVRGKVERTYTAGTPPAGALEGASTTAGTITENGEEKRRSQQPSVEDEENEDTEVIQSQGGVQKDKAATAAPADKAKYWLTERSIGEFARTFNFPARVDQDDVSANLKDGILTVTVPKAKKHEARRIAIN